MITHTYYKPICDIIQREGRKEGEQEFSQWNAGLARWVGVERASRQLDTNHRARQRPTFVHSNRVVNKKFFRRSSLWG